MFPTAIPPLLPPWVDGVPPDQSPVTDVTSYELCALPAMGGEGAAYSGSNHQREET